MTVNYTTADGTATAGADYTATNGMLTFEPGDTTKTVAVPIIDDTVEDDGETFTLTLSDASGATLADAEAVGTINNTEDQTPVDRPYGLEAEDVGGDHHPDVAGPRLVPQLLLHDPAPPAGTGGDRARGLCGVHLDPEPDVRRPGRGSRGCCTCTRSRR